MDVIEHDDDDNDDGDDDEEVAELAESKLHQLLQLKKIYWRAKRQKIQIMRRADLRGVERRIKLFRQRREQRRGGGEQRRKRRNRGEDRPKRGVDRCWGCARPFFNQIIRRWLRCGSCGLWLCPDCGANPVHCQREPQFQ